MTKDYYEVLGIRRSASVEEIELAFKGRRTQYHPDKYGAADAETQQWATQHMQAVNEAYNVLSDSSRRRSHDQRDTDKPSVRPAPTSNSTLNTAVNLRQLLVEQLAPFKGFARTYFAPNIPLKKLSAALESYAGDLKPEDILVLIDTTVFGGSKEGVLLTENEIRVKELAVPLIAFKWPNVTNIQVAGTVIYIQSRKIVECYMVEPFELTRLFNVVSSFIAAQTQRNAHTDNTKARNNTSSDQARAADDAGRSQSKVFRNAQMFRTAKERLVTVCKQFEPLEKQHNDEIVNRANAAGYFGNLSNYLENPHMAEPAYQKLKLIAELCGLILRNEGPPSDDATWALAAEQDDDPQLISELRLILRLGLAVKVEEMRKTEVDQFFGR